MSQSIIQYIRAHNFVEGGRAFSDTFGTCVILGFSSDGWATVAPAKGAMPFGDVPLDDLCDIGGEG